MSTHRWIDRICVIVMALSLIVTALFMNGEKLGIELVSDTDAEGYVGNEYFTANDLNGNWDTSEATQITLSGDSAKITGNGAYWLDNSLVIVHSGQYVISGELTDGNIVVDAAQYSKVWILLNGVTIFCSDDACIRIDQADKVFLTLAEGTENTLNGGDTFSETALADGTNAVIFSHDDLTINGSGSLKIVSSYLNGITSKDDLIIAGGTISVTAPNHGIRVNDHFRMTVANLTVVAEQDGIHSEGDFVIQDGTLTIISGDDAVHSDTSVLVLGGTILVNDCYEGIEAVTIEISGGDTVIHAQDDGLNANGYTGIEFGGGADMQGPMPEMSETPFPGGNMPSPGNLPEMSGTETSTSEIAGEETTTKKVVEAETVTAERIVLSEESSEQNTDHAVAAQESVSAEKETDATSGEGNAFPAESTDQITDKPFDRESRGTMMPFGEGPGSNVDNQSDATEEKTIVSADDTWILISGGCLTILNESGRDADGIDSNGHITMTGGTVLVSLVGSSGNSALDMGSESGGIASISGGTIIACGDSSMAEGFGSESTQASILYSLSETAAAGSMITLLDSEGNELISETIPYSFSSAVISCPEMAVGETYTIRIGEMEENIEMTEVSITAGTAADTGMEPGSHMPGGEGMGPGGFANGETPPEGFDGTTPPERPEGEAGFQPMVDGEGAEPLQGGFGPPENMRDSSATASTPSDGETVSSETQSVSEENVSHQPSEDSSGRNEGIFTEETVQGNSAEQTTATDSSSAWILVLGSILCLALGFVVALVYRRYQHIDS